VKILGVGAVDPLRTTFGFDPKGGGNLPPSFGQLLVAPAQVLHVALGLHRIGEHGHHIHDGEPPLGVVPSAADRPFLKDDHAI
jgi:hypothetical protein